MGIIPEWRGGWRFLAIIRQFRFMLQNIVFLSWMIARMARWMEVSGYHPPISINVTEYRVFILDDSQDGAVASQTKYHRRIMTMVFAFD